LSLIVVRIIFSELVLLGVLLLLGTSHICESFLNPSLLYRRSNPWTKNDYPNRVFLSDADMHSVTE